jgi:hypothetical protein
MINRHFCFYWTKNRVKQLVNLANRHAEFNNQLDAMEKSSLVFNVSGDAPGDANAAGTTKYDWVSGSVKINLGNKWGNKDNMAHEIRHGYGYLVGEEVMSKTTPGLLSDLTDEVVAYQTGYLFTARANDVADGKINTEWLKGVIHSDPRARIAYLTLLGKETSLTVNTPAATLMGYLSNGEEKQFIQSNLNNANLQAIDVMRAINFRYSQGNGHPPYNLNHLPKQE